MEGVVNFTDDGFAKEVLASDLPVLVDFWAPWCGPCRAVAPVVEAVGKKFTGKVKIGKLNTDENPNTAGEYEVMSIPTMIIFKKGKEVERSVGYLSQEALEAKLNKLI